MTILRSEASVICDEENPILRRYYLWGGKSIPSASILGVQKVALTPTRGQLRIWGSVNVKFWSNLDGRRPTKAVGLIFDVGRTVRSFISPDDVDTVDEIVRERAALGPYAPVQRSPFI